MKTHSRATTLSSLRSDPGIRIRCEDPAGPASRTTALTLAFWPLISAVVKSRFSGTVWARCAGLLFLQALVAPLGGQAQLPPNIATLRDSALKGDAAAQFKMGQAYEEGMGVDFDNRQASE
jgi:hypothetical protein